MLAYYKKAPLPVKASFWFLVCSVVQKGISFFTMPIITRLLTTDQYGQVTVYGSWLGIVCIFTTLNLQYGSFNTAQVKFEDRRDEYISSVQSLVTVISIFCMLIAGGYCAWCKDKAIFGIEIFLLMITQILFQFSCGLWMGRKRFDYAYKSMLLISIVRAVLTPLLGILVLPQYVERGTVWIVCLAVIDIVIGFVLYVINYIKGKISFNRCYWKYALTFNIPLIPYYLAQIIFNVSDRIMISEMSGESEAGIYGFAYNIASLLMFIITSVNTAFAPWFYRKVKSRDGIAVRKVAQVIIIVLALLLLAYLLIVPELVMLMGGKKYDAAIWMIPPVTASLLFYFYTDFSCNIAFYYEKKAILVMGTMFSAVFNIILNYIGIQMVGYYIASYTTLVAYILFWLIAYLGARKICYSHHLVERDFIAFGFQLKVAIVFLILVAVCMLLYPYEYIRYALLVIGIFWVIMNRRKLIQYGKNLVKSMNS